jgi:hypothetical protein
VEERIDPKLNSSTTLLPTVYDVITLSRLPSLFSIAELKQLNYNIGQTLRFMQSLQPWEISNVYPCVTPSDNWHMIQNTDVLYERCL